MSARFVARTVAATVLTGLLAVSAANAASAAEAAPGGGAVEDLIALPDGFQPEGIAIGPRGTAYLGSLADGDIYAADLRTGDGAVISQGTGTPSIGLKIDQFGRLFVSGGPSGTARVIDSATGDILATYQLTAGRSSTTSSSPATAPGSPTASRRSCTCCRSGPRASSPTPTTS
jgi:streptogramin lyase